MHRYAIIKDGVVLNVVEYESIPDTPPPGFEEGCVAVREEHVSPGWVYGNGQFRDPNPPRVIESPVTAPVSLADAILSNPTELAKLKAALGLS